MLGFILGKITFMSVLTALASTPQPILVVAEPVPQPKLVVTVPSGYTVSPLQGSYYLPQ